MCKTEGTRDMVQRLRVVAVFAKEQDSVPNNHEISNHSKLLFQVIQ